MFNEVTFGYGITCKLQHLNLLLEMTCNHIKMIKPCFRDAEGGGGGRGGSGGIRVIVTPLEIPNHSLY